MLLFLSYKSNVRTRDGGKVEDVNSYYYNLCS